MAETKSVPAISFDIKLGTYFKYLDIDAAIAADYLVKIGFAEEAISEVNIHVSAKARQDDAEKGLIYGEAQRRGLTLYLGSYVLAVERGKPEEPSVLVTALGSQTIAHELVHVRQFEQGAVPLHNHPDNSLPWDQRPWEVEAIAAQEEYFRSVKFGETDLMLVARLKD